MKPTADDTPPVDEGKEGTADDEDFFPHEVDTHCKVSKPEDHQQKQAADELHLEHLAQQQGTSAPHKHVSTRLCMHRHTGPLLPGYLFPWA